MFVAGGKNTEDGIETMNIILSFSLYKIRVICVEHSRAKAPAQYEWAMPSRVT